MESTLDLNKNRDGWRAARSRTRGPVPCRIQDGGRGDGWGGRMDRGSAPQNGQHRRRSSTLSWLFAMSAGSLTWPMRLQEALAPDPRQTLSRTLHTASSRRSSRTGRGGAGVISPIRSLARDKRGAERIDRLLVKKVPHPLTHASELCRARTSSQGNGTSNVGLHHSRTHRSSITPWQLDRSIRRAHWIGCCWPGLPRGLTQLGRAAFEAGWATWQPTTWYCGTGLFRSTGIASPCLLCRPRQPHCTSSSYHGV